ncbi:HesB/YadR/YfhF family protein [Bacillus sp. H-16]|uniref:iron-sulfur cluster biosynthesis family protein n=1 Tax=Alteribacter salitolerans TaxID=2912333 RepID=UPI0019623D81|nr:HesB/YadR/YfhF family protein [Alteribacter salitolerans]
MEIKITQPAIRWFHDEFDLTEGDSVRIHVRYGGCGSVQTGFSLGLGKEKIDEPGALFEKDGITYGIEAKDLWYFEDKNLTVKYSRKFDEIQFVVE